MKPGLGELLIILVILVLLFGARRLPQIGEGVGKAIRNLKRGLSSDDDIEVTPKKENDEEPKDRRRAVHTLEEPLPAQAQRELAESKAAPYEDAEVVER